MHIFHVLKVTDGKARSLRQAARAAAAASCADAVAIPSIDNYTTNTNTNVEDAMDHEGVEWLNHDDKALKDVEGPEFWA